jgi:hypothetical protein
MSIYSIPTIYLENDELNENSTIPSFFSVKNNRINPLSLVLTMIQGNLKTTIKIDRIHDL